ncbi:MAG: ATP-binding protein [Bacteroidales bacterium]|jgi:predicted AAA+ superfamily ATPase|nr:ATP-binding protein [Bacteroidales bacterium]
MYIKRLIDSELLSWSKESGRKPLLLRGARQVGKSSVVRKLGENFEHFFEINFEKNSEANSFFDGDLDVKKICEALSLQFEKPIIPNKTLLFFDEIQACPRAISSLRFFYEDYPELHVVAAGSLLEFALEELPSFGVGRIRSLFMNPFSFQEFVTACGSELLWEKICEHSPENPIFEPFHKKALELLKRFLVVGGMPAVVAKYTENQDIMACQIALNDLINSLKSDFSKYKARVPEMRITTAFESVVNQAGGRFNFSKAEQLNYYQVKESIELLEKAGLIIPVIHSSANGIPLGAEVNFKKQKIILLDTGIFQHLLGLKLSDVLFSNDIEVVNKSAIAEMFVGLELIKSAPFDRPRNLYFWTREKEKSKAEVDYVLQLGRKIIPIEVKSGKTGKMQSMHLFIEEKKSEYGIRTSLENFSQYDKIKVYPLYAIANAAK